MKTKSIVALAGLILLGVGAVPQLSAQSFSVLHNFTGNPDGAYPGGLLLSGSTLLGTTRNGGSANNGLVFVVGTNGSGLTILHDFAIAPDGAQPNQLLLNGGLIYGTTRGGGTNNWGTIFRMAANGSGYTQLHIFTNGVDGFQPYAGLITDGSFLYGTTQQGGSAAVGTLFRLEMNGANFTSLHTFTNKADGANPFASLTLSGTNLYGTTKNGGLGTNGTIFKIGTNGAAYAVLFNFSNNPAASYPSSELLVISNVIYGTSSQGGNANSGTVFKLGIDGSGFTILHNFTGPTTPVTNSDGGSPAAGLTLKGNLFYGITTIGGSGSGSSGTIFQMNTNGTGFVVLKNFDGSTDGSFSQAGLVLGANNLYGTGYLGGSAGSGTIFSLLFSPAITSQPQNLTVASGSPATFSITVSDVGSVNYQWYFNTNTLLSGQTGSSLNLASATNGNAGYYTVAASDSFASVTSSPALLTVSSQLIPPSISVQPQPQTVTNGFSANFSVTAGGSSQLLYQWYFNSNTGNPNLLGTGLGGQTSSTLSFTVGSGSGGYYSVIVSNTVGTVTSSPALLTVAPAITKPSITAQPQPQSVTNGLTANFSVTATGSASLNYQWYFNANTGSPNLLGSGLGGQIGSTLSFAVDTNSAGYYTVIVTNAGGAATSTPALLTVIVPAINAKPQILTQPQGLNVTNGDTANFSVVATNGGLTYQWYFNTNNLLANQTNNLLAIAGTATGNAGTYSVVVTNNFGSVTSSLATLTIYSNTKPIITQPPQTVLITSGDTAYISATVVGLPPLRYQWYFNTNGGSSGTLLAGQTNNFRSFTAATNASGNYYFVVITNTLGKATSSPPALLTVVAKPTIITNPPPLTVNVGDTATFTVSALGLTLQYQWYSNSIASALGTLLAGQTNSTYSFTSALNANGSFYSVLITNPLGRATSSPALLTVNSASTVAITLQPVDKTITNGDPVSFTAAASGSGTLSYQWFFQTNVLINGATSPTLAFATANQPGTYSMKVTSGASSVTSSPAKLTVAGRPIMVSANFDAASGSYAFSFVNLAGSTNRLMATTNLTSTTFWRAIATNVMATNALWFVTDTNSAKTNAARFYRFSTP